MITDVQNEVVEIVERCFWFARPTPPNPTSVCRFDHRAFRIDLVQFLCIQHKTMTNLQPVTEAIAMKDRNFLGGLLILGFGVGVEVWGCGVGVGWGW